MKLSTRSRYGTRMMVDLAQHYGQGPVQTGEIARRQGVSVKYLEQLLIPLKKASYVMSVRGRKGGHVLSKPPQEISLGEVVGVLEGGISLAECIRNPKVCARTKDCPTREVWEEVTKAMLQKLDSIYLSDLIARPTVEKTLNLGLSDGAGEIAG